MAAVSVPLPGRAYDIVIESGALAKAGRLCREVLPKAEALLVVTDENVGPLYGPAVEKSLASAGFRVKTVTLPAGEATKSLFMLERLYDALTDFGITRTDAIAALGGGVIGDLAGFAAATILRGIDYVQIPTTLLAQVDSSVGGKVAIDLKAGKNLAGAFWQPKLVVMDPDCLDTLPDREFACGMAEVVKYGCIRDEKLFDFLALCGGRADVMASIGYVLETCVKIKAEIVLADERDTGLRRLLNFGHTLGHAYELFYNYEKYSHGEAVAAGMCAAADLGLALGVTEPGVPAKVRALVKKFGLPERIDCSLDAYTQAVGLDKKSEGAQLAMIFLTKIGRAEAVKLDKAQVMALIRAWLAE